MTRKDFKLIADVIRHADEIADDMTLAAIAENLADALGTTNPLFNRAKFLDACGVK
jgi:hypothetical protein